MNATPQVMQENLVITACAVELATRVIRNVAGNEASNMLQGASITDAFVADAVTSRLQAKLTTNSGSR